MNFLNQNPQILPLLALVLTVALCFFLVPVSRYFGLLARPDARKQHLGDIPLVGGPAIVLSVALVMLLRNQWTPGLQVLAWSAGIVFFTGIADDRWTLPVPLRFALQILALLGMVFFGGVQLFNFGHLMWPGLLGLGPLAIPLTVFSALGVINAFNMIDGMDGLSSSLALVALGSLTFFAGRGGFAEEQLVLLVIAGATAGFFLMNFRFPWRAKAWVFLGDSGTSWIGFVLAWFFISLSQNDPVQGTRQAYAPITAIWLFALPLMDTTYVMIRRAREGRPIFQGDRNHLHHLFLRSGFPVRVTWSIMSGAALLMALIGTYAELRHWPEWAMFYAYLVLSLAYLFWMNRSWKQRRFLGRQIN